MDRLPSKFLDRGPRVERHYGHLHWDLGGTTKFIDDDRRESRKSRWCDHWVYDDLRWPVPAGFAALGPVRGLEARTPISYDEMLPGAHDQAARLEDMDVKPCRGSLCFPTVRGSVSNFPGT